MPVEFKELFFSDPRNSVDPQNGYIWKPVLRAGEWKVGPNGVPLVVVHGRSIDQHKAIGLQDIVDNFDKGVVEHVTIPLSHDDNVDQNTGYIRGLKVQKVGDDHLLMAAHDFTEPDVKGKVERGTIPNTSVGLEFDYTHKETGAKIPVVLKHVALTHRPWINRLKPFGVAASDDSSYQIDSLEFSEPTKEEDVAHLMLSAWNTDNDIESIRSKIKAQLGQDAEPVTMARDSVLVKTSDGKQFVVQYSVDGQNVSLAARDSWVQHLPIAVDSNPPAPAVPAPTPTPEPSAQQKENEIVSDQNAQSIEALQQALAAAQTKNAEMETKLSEAQETIQTQGSTVASLAVDKRERDAEDFLTDLRGMGLSEDAGCTDLLVYVRNICLSDTGASALLLSETAETTPVALQVTEIVRNIFSKMPTDEKTGKLAIKLSEQVPADPLRQTARLRPPIEPDETKLSEDSPEFDTTMDSLYEQMYGSAPAGAATAS